MLRVAFVSSVFPYPPNDGMKWRIFHLLSGLSKYCEIDLIVISETAPDIALDHPIYGCCTKLIYLPTPPCSWRRLRLVAQTISLRPYHVQRLSFRAVRCELGHLLSAGKYDVIHFETLPVAQYMTCAPKGSIRILGEQNYEAGYWRSQTLRAKSLLAKAVLGWNAYRTSRFEALACSISSGVVAVTPEDAEAIATAYQPGNLTVAPVGIDSLQVPARVTGVPRRGSTVCFIGSMHLQMNIDAVEYFASKILPLIMREQPDVRFVVVGKDPPARIRDLADRLPVTVTGAVESVSGYLEAADVVVIPLRIGSGMKVKVLEAMAHGKAIVTTSLGAAGLQAVDGEHLLVADDAGPFADAVIRLLQDKDFADQLGHSAREHALELFDSKRIAARLTSWYECLVSRQGSV